MTTERISALAIGIGSILSLALMGFHPTVQAHGAAGFVEEAVREATVNGFVHGAMIVAALTILFGYIGFAQHLGPGLARVRAGLVFYATGTLVMVGAAVVSGFVTPGFAARYTEATPEELEGMTHVVRMLGQTVHVCARTGILLTSLSVLLWSLILVRGSGLRRAAGGVGLAACALPVVGIASGHMHMTVHGFGAFLALQAAWNLMVAALLVRRS